ncbi:hypothetical protein J6A64_08740 [bacterium]|nr:hypothetical protein [bacterium]
MSVEAINLVNYSPYYVVLPNGSPEGKNAPVFPNDGITHPSVGGFWSVGKRLLIKLMTEFKHLVKNFDFISFAEMADAAKTIYELIDYLLGRGELTEEEAQILRNEVNVQLIEKQQHLCYNS